MLEKETNQTGKLKPFWDSTTGAIIKLAAVLTALTTIFAFFKPILGYVTDAFQKSAVVNDVSSAKIKSVIASYYATDDNEAYKEYADLFTDPVKNYFGQAHVTHEQIIQGSIDYHAKWPIRQYQANYSTLIITAEKSNYLVSFRLDYKLKRKPEQEWRTFSLVIHLTLNTDFKISSIYEAKL